MEDLFIFDRYVKKKFENFQGALGGYVRTYVHAHQQNRPIFDEIKNFVSCLNCYYPFVRSYKSNYLPTHGQGDFDFRLFYYRLFKYLVHFPGVPTVVKTNILIRSMGPISELDMVNYNNLSIDWRHYQ